LNYIFREFFEDVSKVATQYVPPRQPNEPFHSKVGKYGDWEMMRIKHYLILIN
jgi:hypothetical protein